MIAKSVEKVKLVKKTVPKENHKKHQLSEEEIDHRNGQLDELFLTIEEKLTEKKKQQIKAKKNETSVAAVQSAKNIKKVPDAAKIEIVKKP